MLVIISEWKYLPFWWFLNGYDVHKKKKNATKITSEGEKTSFKPKPKHSNFTEIYLDRSSSVSFQIILIFLFNYSWLNRNWMELLQTSALDFLFKSYVFSSVCIRSHCFFVFCIVWAKLLLFMRNQNFYRIFVQIVRFVRPARENGQ